VNVPVWAWLAFVAGVVAVLAVDLFAHRRDAVIGFREAARWSALWVGLGLAFAGVVWIWGGSAAAGQYTSAWLLEKSLSVDNLFVFALIFSYFRVPDHLLHRVLFFGVLGALVLRFGFIAAGSALLHSFHFMLYIFGAFLLVTAVRMIKGGDEQVDVGRNVAVRALRRVMPVADGYAGHRFFIRDAGRLVATPLLAVLVAIETADVLFAVDSVPAALSVTNETFLVYSSNALAILGLRSLYFLLAGMLDRFHHLGTGLAVILAFVGVKMIITDVAHIPTGASLAAIAAVLTASVVASLLTSPAAEGEPGGADSAAGSSSGSSGRPSTEAGCPRTEAGPSGQEPVGAGSGGPAENSATMSRPSSTGSAVTTTRLTRS
jgi:tellurite resistance protein TerC